MTGPEILTADEREAEAAMIAEWVETAPSLDAVTLARLRALLPPADGGEIE
ncbi:hypothetical protein O3Q52_16660 [Streptomyces sp. ActVer]|uniref:hypothetical protein n=1 Tax=Streptomyces sp. ActVer TaxID=3014558 RepID=UPI0022B3245A|nr:hypothetical protein [Streptomyces sp. ActVer]MCZ4509798.1 hypothetical protein [Streptomyces sp. ActVer]